MKISKDCENILIIIWALTGASIIAAYFIIRYNLVKTKNIKSTVTLETSLLKFSPNDTQHNITQNKIHGKIRTKLQNQRAFSPLLFRQTSQKDNQAKPLRSSQKTQPVKQINASPKPSITQLVALPFEIQFSAQFIYPSFAENHTVVYPLPGLESTYPIARIGIANKYTLIYNTQFGVLEPSLKLSHDELTVHQNCLETGKVVFDKKLRLFKTHPVRTCGDQRIYATQQIKKEGLTLYIFNQMVQHAHPGK